MRIKKLVFLLSALFLAGLIVPISVDAATTAVIYTEYGPTQVNTDQGVVIEYIIRVGTDNGSTSIAPTAVNLAGLGTLSLPTLVYSRGNDQYYRVIYTTNVDPVSTSIQIRFNAGGVPAVDSTPVTRAANFTGLGLKGITCANDQTSLCAAVTLQGAGNVQLVCERNKCVPPKSRRSIGTFCEETQQAAHCDNGTGQLTFSCTSGNFCAGATPSVQCLADSVVNQFLLLGKVAEQVSVTDRCDTGLICDADTGVCENDVGQSAVPTDRLGETATDIRDQIRNLINIALGFLGVAGVIITIYGGALWMSAAGDDEKVEKAKKTIVSGLIGLIIIGIAWTIVSYVLSVTGEIS